MAVHCFLHVPFEGLGSIAPWLENAGHEISTTKFFGSWELPDVHDMDLLVVMGGSMSVNDEDEFPWLLAEKEFIRKAIDSGVPVLGICLGAQLIASAMGARVYANSMKEIGWFPIQGISSNSSSILRLPETENVFHWHGETFDLPAGAIHLARSAACENQAFQIGSSVIGLQFHLETTLTSALDIVTYCHDELVSAKYIQAEEEILSAPPERYAAMHRLLGKVLSFLLKNNG